MTATLFQTGNDLSDNFMKVCYRRMKANSFDVYEMIGNANVSIKHHARRGPSELIKEDPIKEIPMLQELHTIPLMFGLKFKRQTLQSVARLF